MKIGFTGTRYGLTSQQRNELNRILRSKGTEQFHHGDCRGADWEAHHLARRLLIPVVLHPPVENTARAHCRGWDISRVPLPYLERNRAIVDETDELIACPRTYTEEAEPRSGTWYTVRYAARIGRPVLIILPDGLHARRNHP
jgi:hypothetical protein